MADNQSTLKLEHRAAVRHYETRQVHDPPSSQPAPCLRRRRPRDPADGLGNMREHGVRSVAAECHEIRCGHLGSVNVDDLPDDVPVPDVALRLRCSACGSRNIKTVPD